MYETIFVILGAYLSYSLAHLPFFQLSGDVAIFFYGVMMSHYNKYNMSEGSFRNIGLTFNILMQGAEAICFIYIGLSFEDAFVRHYENFSIAGGVLLVLFISRSIVFIVSAFIFRNNQRFKIKGGEWFAVIVSGLVKGPMAYIFSNVLVPNRSPCLDVTNLKQYLKSFPLFVMQICVIFSLILIVPLNFLFFKMSVSKQLDEGEEAERKKKKIERINMSSFDD